MEVPRKLQSAAKLLWHNHSLHAKGQSVTCLGGSLNPCSYIPEELVVNVYLTSHYFPWELYCFCHIFLNINKEHQAHKKKNPTRTRNSIAPSSVSGEKKESFMVVRLHGTLKAVSRWCSGARAVVRESGPEQDRWLPWQLGRTAHDKK